MTTIPKANQIYRNYKGNLYRIVTLATHADTKETMVVYQALFGDYTIYVRELSVFMSKVDKRKHPDADQEERFTLVTEIIGQSEDVSEMPSIRQKGQGSDEKPQESGAKSGGETPEKAEQTGAGPEAEEPALDPFLMEFLDADTYEEKMNLLVALHARITDDMINTMAVSLDVEVNDGDIEDRYEALKTCLLTLQKYECNRLR